VLSREATNTNSIVSGFTRSGLEPTIYRIRGSTLTITPPMRFGGNDCPWKSIQNCLCGTLNETDYEFSYGCFNNVFKHISAYRRRTDRNTEILLKEALNTIKLTKPDRNRTGYVIVENQLP
jgi:hypothetical protein